MDYQKTESPIITYKTSYTLQDKQIGCLGLSIKTSEITNPIWNDYPSIKLLLAFIPRNLLPFSDKNRKIFESLSPQSQKILHCTLQGKTASDIAQELNRSIRTIESYLDIIKTKFGCTKKKELFSL